MGIPESIRSVKRPVNTVVIDQGGNSPKRYAVRCRASVKYVKNGNPQPISGKIVGYIINGQYVPRQTVVTPVFPEFLSWGGAAFVKSVSEDILQDLYKVMDCKNAILTLVLAALRILYPRVPNSRLRSRYQKSYLSIFYPDVALSENTVSKFLCDLGANMTVRKAFCLERLKRVAADHHIAIDGTLIQDSSKVNDLSGFSYKARIKGCKELSVLYAYDVEKNEPICAQVFPGNQPDICTCKEFIASNHIDRGIIVADKGFNLKEIRKLREASPELHYLVALKRDDKRVKTLGLLKMKEFLGGELKPILCSKAKADDNTWLYAFRDTARAQAEERTYLENRQNKHSIDPEEYEKKRDTFGVLAFESDQDLPCQAVYETYKNRWLLELIFRQYKTGLEANQTRVQGDYSVIGSEFINFLCTIITSRMVKAEKEAGLLDELSYGSILEDLNEAWREVNEQHNDVHIEDQYWVHTTLETKSILAKLGLALAPAPEPPKKRGRKKKVMAEQVPATPKRPRGRPRIHPLPDPSTKRKPGRPRLHPLDDQAPKSGVGRSKKENRQGADIEKASNGQ